MKQILWDGMKISASLMAYFDSNYTHTDWLNYLVILIDTEYAVVHLIKGNILKEKSSKVTNYFSLRKYG